ncbi:MAG: dihydrodipicolinate synthase family protein [Lentisphaeraceae bacterium]|nr:dihydrodipicolinate synthase family protein [Lentisphaeraceae bacterium]
MDKLKGLIAATFTPLNDDGSINLIALPPMIEDAIEAGINGFYILGTAGEGVSLKTSERKILAEEFIRLVAGRKPIIVQIGHNSIEESKELAKHALEVGANAISANAPSYFKVNKLEILIECLEEICSAAPQLPFYYYHIPAFTGAHIDMLEFLKKAPALIPSLTGIKFSEPDPGKYLQCKIFLGAKYDILWGCDQHLLAALAVGAEGAIGSTYNFMPKLYLEMTKNHRQGNIDMAQLLMNLACDYIEILERFGPIHPCMKTVMRILGYPVGQHRLPQASTSPEQERQLQVALAEAGFFEWSIKSVS